MVTVNSISLVEITEDIMKELEVTTEVEVTAVEVEMAEEEIEL